MLSKQEQTGSTLTWLQIYQLAARPRTLYAAAAPVVMGSVIAFTQDHFLLIPALVTMLTALLLQIGANIANDVYDFHKGADTAQRQGPQRVTASGLWTPRQTLIAMWLTFGLAAVLGLYLVVVGGWPVVIMGLAAILCAIFYTGGPLPLGYYGLGDIFVFVFFGPVAVIGTYYIQAHQITPLAAWASVPVGLLVVNILVVNNLRDIETDRAAHKITLAVLLGATGTRIEYTVLLLASFLVPLALWLLGLAPVLGLLSWLAWFMAVSVLSTVWRQTGRTLNLALAGSGQLALLFAVLFGIGLIVAKVLS